MQTHLVFVYNADSGLFNTITDIAHKIMSPETYSCQLCSLTHSYFTVKQDWTSFLEGLDVKLEFLHRDEILARYGISNVSLPVIFLNKNNQLTTWITTEEINDCSNMEALKTLIRNRLKQ